jgi:hypothetical protein
LKCSESLSPIDSRIPKYPAIQSDWTFTAPFSHATLAIADEIQPQLISYRSMVMTFDLPSWTIMQYEQMNQNIVGLISIRFAADNDEIQIIFALIVRQLAVVSI